MRPDLNPIRLPTGLRKAPKINSAVKADNRVAAIVAEGVEGAEGAVAAATAQSSMPARHYLD
jgi:hypothetical protein